MENRGLRIVGARSPRPIFVFLFVYLFMPLSLFGAEQLTQGIDKLESRLEQAPDDATAHYELGLALAMKDDSDAALTHLERAIHPAPENLKYGNAYRMICIKFNEIERAIKFLEQAVKDMEEANQDFQALRLNLALAYVDRMPSSDIGIVTQARLSTKSIRLLEKVLAKQPDSWAGTFALGMNHLYWPKALRHAPKSIAAFEKCIAIQDAMVKETGKCQPYFVRGYLGLGDAYVKHKKFDKAREVWRQAKAYFPDHPRLQQRLKIANDKALGKFIDKERGLGVVVNTDLTVLWHPESEYEDVFAQE